MLLEAFKKLHSIESIQWKRSKKTQRLVCCNSQLPIVASKKCDFKKELHIIPCTTRGDVPQQIFVVCNQGGWEDVDFES